MLMFYTEYDAPGGAVFASCVLAQSEAGAQDLIALRGIGERVVGFPVLNALETVSFATIESLMQELIFTSWVAVVSGVQTPNEVLGPKGWMFELTCMYSTPREPVVSAVNTLLANVNTLRASLGMPRIQRLR